MAECNYKIQLFDHAFYLARLSQNLLQGEALTKFIQRNTKDLV